MTRTTLPGAIQLVGVGECRLSTANKGAKIVSVQWSGLLTGCHYLEAKIKEQHLNN